MGIGFACVRHCLEAGANVLLCARGAADIDLAVSKLTAEYDSRVIGMTADVAKRADVRRTFDELEKILGRLDAVIHAAAVLPPIGRIDVVDPDEWWQTVEINLLGTFNVVREACIRFKKHSTSGRIAVFAGGGATSPFPNYTAYACSKVAIVRFIETVALEMVPFGIELNCIAPGFVATRMHRETLSAGVAAGEDYFERTRRQLQSGGVSPDVAAAAAIFLISHESLGITGKLAAAVYDSYTRWPTKLKELHGTDIFTLRRITPKDRGMNWQ